jgi:hypothetical protein
MGENPGDRDKNEPDLELPTLRLPGLGRRGKKADRRAERRAEAEPDTAPEQEPEAAVSAGQAEPETSADADSSPVETGVTSPRAETAPARGRSDHAASVIDDATLAGEPTPARAHRTARRRTSGRAAGQLLPTRLAPVVTGALVGAVGTGLTYLGLRGCELTTGTDSCGGAQGLLLLLAIAAVMVLVGGLLLRAGRVTDPAATSFLAVGIVTVVVMMALLDIVFTAWMVAIMPVLGAASFAMARWVTTRFAEEPERSELHDVR